jgi:hypothetical protein
MVILILQQHNEKKFFFDFSHCNHITIDIYLIATHGNLRFRMDKTNEFNEKLGNTMHLIKKKNTETQRSDI